MPLPLMMIHPFNFANNFMKTLFFGIIAAIFISACSTVSLNQYTLYTSDCWNRIEVVQAGDIMPTLNSPCKKIVPLPAFDMPGEVEVKTRFKNDVKGTITVTPPPATKE